MIQLRKRCYVIPKYYVPILIVAVIATAIGGYYSSKLTLQSDLAQLLPDSFESVKTLNRIKEKVGGVGQLRIALETRDFAAAKRLAHDLEPKLLASPRVNYVDYKNDVGFFKNNAMLYLDLDELDSLRADIQGKIDSEKQKLNPLFVDDLFADTGSDSAASDNDLSKWEDKYSEFDRKEYYTNDDSTVLVIKVFPASTNSNLKFIQQMFDEVQAIVVGMNPTSYAPDMQVYYGGNFKNKLDEYKVIKKDIMGTALYGFGGVFLLIVLYFRRLVGALLITMTLLFSLTWTFGITYWVIGELNTITGFLFVILFGLGIDYGIHAFARYAESKKAGLSFEESMEKLICQTGRALITTAFTTSAAFFSLTLMKFKGFSDLGFISGVGILFAATAMMVVLPAFITLFEKFNLMRIERVPSKSLSFEPMAYRHSGVVLIGSALLTLLAIYSFAHLQFEYDFTNLRVVTEDRKLIDEKTQGVCKLSESPAVVLADSKSDIDEVVAAVRKIIETDKESPTIKTVRSAYSMVPGHQVEKIAKIRSIKRLIDTEADGVVKGDDKETLDQFREYLNVSKPFTWEDFPENNKRQFIDKQGQLGKFVFIYPSVALRNGLNAIEFLKDVGTIKTASGKVFHASSSNIITAEMLLIMIKEGKLAVLLTLLVVFVIVLIDFRKLGATLLVLSPLLVGVAWMGLAMFLMGMKLNFFNIVVFPSIIGVGVDNGVHIYHRYREEGPGSLLHVLKNTGMAISMTTATTIVGYSGLILASHPGLNSIGDLAVIGLLATFVTAMIVLPALLQSIESRAS